MGKKAEKGKKGQAIEYYSRKQALRHLQIGLPNFIRLCLWKSIYPTQPNNVKKVSKGDGRPKIYYKRKDINLLIHEPIVAKLREMRSYNLKLKRAKERNDKDKLFRLQKRKPRYTLHHIVKELYSTREDALRNLDDCLKSVFIFATLPKMTQFNGAYIGLCKRLKLEWLNYCIAKQAVRKCFISVKGYHLEVEINSIAIRWVMPHQHVAMSLPSSADYRMLANQMEFDCTMLSSLLKNLYTEAGLMYPPQFQMTESIEGALEWSENDILSSMTFPLASSEIDISERLEALNQFRDMDEDVAAAADKEVRIAAIQSLFKDKKVFLNREVPREIFCFLLRSCGANVSWDNAAGNGATFDENDEQIIYHIIDRPLINARVNRSYVQPQFVFDCINAARLLPVKDFMPGCKLIPHLSPFVDYTKGYVPPEYRYLQGEINADELYTVDDVEDEGIPVDEREDGDSETSDEDEEEEMMEMELDKASNSDEEVADISQEEPKAVVMDNKNDKRKKQRNNNNNNNKKPSQKATQQKRIPKQQFDQEIAARNQIKLKEMNLPKKRLNLYNKMKYAEKKEKTTVENMNKKRQEVNKKRNAAKK